MRVSGPFVALTLLLVVSSTPAALFAGEATSAGEPTLASLEGRWLLGEMGEEFDAILECRGATAVASPIRQRGDDGPISFVLAKIEGALFTMKASREGKELAFFLLVTNANEALLWRAGDDDLARALRLGDLPPALVGEWTLEHPRRPGRDQRLVVSPTGSTLTKDGETIPIPLFPIATAGSTLGLATSVKGADREPLLFHLQPLPRGGFLLWGDGEDDYVLMYRQGQRPDWFPPRGAR